MKAATGDLSLGRWSVRHETVRVCLFLLPVWLLGAGDLARFAFNNTLAGDFERNRMVKGRDYVQFYVAGTLAREGSWSSVYDVASLERSVARIVPASAGSIPAPLYGPQVALLFAPLSKLPYLVSRWCWFIASGAIYLVAAWIVIACAGALRQYRALTWITVVCNPVLSMLLSTGQTGALATLVWALGAYAYLRDRLLLFGVCLGLLAYKPPLLIGAIPVLLLTKNYAALAGATISALAQVAISLVIAGAAPWNAYVSNLRRMSDYYFLTDTLPYQKQSIPGFFQLLFGAGMTTAILSAVAVAVVAALWWPHRRDRRAVWLLPMLATTTVLLSPHLYVYDLVLMTPVLILTADALLRAPASTARRASAWAGYAMLYAPFSGAFALHRRVQLSTIVLVVFFVAVHRIWLADHRRRSGQQVVVVPDS